MKTSFYRNYENKIIPTLNMQAMSNGIHNSNSIQVTCGNRQFSQVKEAVMLANELLGKKEFYDRIAAHNAYAMANVSPAGISELMRTTRLKMTVDLYYAMNSTLNIDGYDDTEHPFTIHLNIWKIDRSPASICNTIIHACVHAVNAQHPEHYFGHGDHTVAGKDNTAPYRIGALAQQMVSKDEPVYITLEHDVNDARRNDSQLHISAFLDGNTAHAHCFYPTD